MRYTCEEETCQHLVDQERERELATHIDCQLGKVQEKGGHEKKRSKEDENKQAHPFAPYRLALDNSIRLVVTCGLLLLVPRRFLFAS